MTKDATATKELKHTPGPWAARMQRSIRGEALGWIIETAHGRRGRIGWASRAYDDTNVEAPREGDEQTANARLIAAAPQLLSLLMIVEESFQRGDCCHICMRHPHDPNCGLLDTLEWVTGVEIQAARSS